MKNLKFLPVLLLALSSCTHHEGAMKSEKGIVVEKQFQPSVSGTAFGNGFDTDGNVTFSSHTITTEEKFCVVFKCQHGVVFSINRNNLYASLDKGDSVLIFYYNLAPLFSNVTCDYDFVEATKMERPAFNTDSLNRLIKQ